MIQVLLNVFIRDSFPGEVAICGVIITCHKILNKFTPCVALLVYTR